MSRCDWFADAHRCPRDGVAESSRLEEGIKLVSECSVAAALVCLLERYPMNEGALCHSGVCALVKGGAVQKLLGLKALGYIFMKCAFPAMPAAKARTKVIVSMMVPMLVQVTRSEHAANTTILSGHILIHYHWRGLFKSVFLQ